MAKGDWWFKFEWEDWLNDDELLACTLETQGFWIKCIAMMHRAGVDEFIGTIDQLRRKFGILPEELTRCLTDLKNNKAADVRFGKEDVSIMSRRMRRTLKAKENNRLYVATHRMKDECKDDVRRQSYSKSKSKEKEKKEETPLASPPQDKKPVKRGSRIPDTFLLTPEMREWGKDRRPDVNLNLETEKFVNYWRAAAGRNATKLDWIASWRTWILGAKKDHGISQKPLTAADRNWQRTVANEQLGEDLRAGKLDGLLDELHRRDPLYRHQVAPLSEPPAALAGGFDDYGEGLDGLSETDHPGAPFS